MKVDKNGWLTFVDTLVAVEKCKFSNVEGYDELL